MDVESERPADYVPEIARAVADHMDDFNKVLNSFRCVVPDGLMVFIHEAFLTKPTAKPDRGSDVLPQGKKVFDADARPTYPDGHPTLAWKFGPNNAVVPDHEGRAAICGRILLAMLQGFQYPRIPLLAQRVDNCAPLNAAMPQNVAEVFRALLRTMTRDECADSDARALADGIRAYLTNMPHGLGGIQRHLEAARAAEELENCPGNFPLGLIFTDEAIPLRPQFETMLRSLYADLNVAIRLARPIDWETDDPVLPDWDVEALRPALMWDAVQNKGAAPSARRSLTATAAVDKEAESLLVRTPYQPIYEGAVRATWAGVRFQPPSTIVGGLADDPAEAAPSATPSAPAPAQAAAQTAAPPTAPQQARPRRNAGQAVGRGGRGQGHQRGGRHRGRDGRGHRDRGGDRGGGQAQPAQPAVDPNDPFGLDAFLARQQGYDPKTMRVTVSDGKVKVERIAESAPPDQAPPAETPSRTLMPPPSSSRQAEASSSRRDDTASRASQARRTPERASSQRRSRTPEPRRAPSSRRSRTPDRRETRGPSTRRERSPEPHRQSRAPPPSRPRRADGPRSRHFGQAEPSPRLAGTAAEPNTVPL
eukprot:tig00020688_g12997.t1